MVKLCSMNPMTCVYIVCLISLATSFMLEKLLDVHQRHDSDTDSSSDSNSNGLDPEDQRNLSDPGWKHPNWREICRLQDSRLILRPKFTIPRTKSRMPIPPKCGIRAMYKDQEEFVVIDNDQIAQWDQFETLDQLYAAAQEDPLTFANLDRYYPSLATDTQSATDTRYRKGIQNHADKVPRWKSIVKDVAYDRTLKEDGNLEDQDKRALGQNNNDDLKQDKADDVDINDDDEKFVKRIFGTKHRDLKGEDLTERTFDSQDTDKIADGQEQDDIEERVIGGEEIDEHEWPWVVAIGPRDFGQICGGTLISSRWVLSAAHCFPQRLNPCDYIVRLGEHNLNEDEEKHIDIIPSRIIVHEDFTFYTDGNPANDIALIQLSKPVKLTQRIHVACLPDMFEFPTPGTKCTLVGWGFLEAFNFNQLPNKPHAVEIETFSRETCGQVWGEIITRGMFCAGDLRGGKDACAGDSGGPLVCQNSNNGKYDLVGIVSFGRDQCGEPGFGGVYTLVSRYTGWMERMVKQIRKEDLYDARWWANLADNALVEPVNSDTPEIQNSLFQDLFTDVA